MSLKNKVMSGLRWTAGAKFLSQLITWCITIVIIRLLSPADYGLMELSVVFVSFLVMLNELGLGAAIVQRKTLDNSALRSVFGLVLLISVFFCLVLVLVAPVIASFYNEPRLILLVRALAMQFLLMGFVVLPQSLLLREMAFRKIATVDFVSAITGSLITLSLALLGFGVWALVWGALSIRIVSTIGLNIAQPFPYFPQFNMRGVWPYFTFGGYVTLSRIFWYFYSRADVLIIGKILGKDFLGFYAVGLYLASLPMEKLSNIINQVAFPAFSSMQSDPVLAGQHFLKAIRIMSFFSFPVLWGISSIAPEIVDIFLGEKWAESALPLQVIALIIPVRMISNLTHPVVLGAGRPDISFYNSLVAFILMPGAFYLGSFWGLWGVSLAWVVVFPVVFCLNLSRIVKVLEVKYTNVIKAMLSPLWASLIMYVGIILIRKVFLIGTPSIGKMFILITCGSIFYTLWTFLFNRRDLQEIIGLVRK